MQTVFALLRKRSSIAAIVRVSNTIPLAVLHRLAVLLVPSATVRLAIGIVLGALSNEALFSRAGRHRITEWTSKNLQTFSHDSGSDWWKKMMNR
jgi:hypothetical protein